MGVSDLDPGARERRPWNVGNMVGAKRPLKPRDVNTGHPGSMTTIHADSPERAIDQLAMLVLQGGSRMSWDNVVGYIRRSIDLFVQLKREGGIRSVEAVSMQP